ELIDASVRALSEWRSQPDSADFGLGLKRPLHTLKGGARVAGITPMGDLSHELETLVMAVDNGTVAADVAVFDVIQASLYEPAPAEIADAGPVSDTGLGPALTRERAPELHAEEGLLAPQPVPPGREPVAGGERQEMARVDADLLDQMLNISGEASIARARLEQQLGSFDFNLGELSRTVTRLKEQLRSLEIETEAQILHKHE